MFNRSGLDVGCNGFAWSTGDTQKTRGDAKKQGSLLGRRNSPIDKRRRGGGGGKMCYETYGSGTVLLSNSGGHECVCGAGNQKPQSAVRKYQVTIPAEQPAQSPADTQLLFCDSQEFIN